MDELYSKMRRESDSRPASRQQILIIRTQEYRQQGDTCPSSSSWSIIIQVHIYIQVYNPLGVFLNKLRVRLSPGESTTNSYKSYNTKGEW